MRCKKVEALWNQIVELPEAVQTELIQALVEMQAESLGIYVVDDNERAALARSSEDVRISRFASGAEMEETFSRSGN